MIITFIVAWQLIGLVAFAVYAARAGEFWTAKRRYVNSLRFALGGKNRPQRYRLLLSRGNRQMEPVAWHAESRFTIGRRRT